MSGFYLLTQWMGNKFWNQLYGNFHNSYMLKHLTFIWWYLQDLSNKFVRLIIWWLLEWGNAWGVGHFQNDCVPKAEWRGDYFRNPLAMGVNQQKGLVEFFFPFLLIIPSAYLPSTIPASQVWQNLYYFLKCQNFRELRSLPAEFFKNYCLWMPKFYRIQEVVPG